MAINTLFQNIADAIRERGGTSAALTPAQMPQAILDIPGGSTSIKGKITVTGGYNGGATINVYIEDMNTPAFTAVGNSPYNLVYSPSSGTVTSSVGNINISVIPPSTNTSPLSIALTGAVSYLVSNIMPQGSNTSYGYNYDSGEINLTV